MLSKLTKVYHQNRGSFRVELHHGNSSLCTFGAIRYSLVPITFFQLFLVLTMKI